MTLLQAVDDILGGEVLAFVENGRLYRIVRGPDDFRLTEALGRVDDGLPHGANQFQGGNVGTDKLSDLSRAWRVEFQNLIVASLGSVWRSTR
jgi:hypothetical protein